jgi:hypothetical protein
MRTEEETVKETWYISEAYPGIRTTNERDGSVIEWADKNVVIYDIVMERKSKAFGQDSSAYIGWAQKNNSTSAILEKMRAVKDETARDDIWGWRARFTLKHYKDKGFRGGYFQQWDRYPRNSLYLDYTPETMDEAIKHFVGWMDGYYDTKKITVDGKEIPEERWRRFLEG